MIKQAIKSFYNFRRKYNRLFIALCLLSLFIPILTVNRAYDSLKIYLDKGSENKLRLYRDVYKQERWPGIEPNLTDPSQVTPTAHLFWCGERVFRFEHYVSALSAVRILRPQKIIFHYKTHPVVDEYWYHTWFQELKNSVSNLVLSHHYLEPECGTIEYIKFALQHLAEEGGIYIGDTTVLTRYPTEALLMNKYSVFRINPENKDYTQGIFISRTGFDPNLLSAHIESIVTYSGEKCQTVEEFDAALSSSSSPHSSSSSSSSQLSKHSSVPCVVIQKSFYPKDIWDSPTPFSEIARWLFYGARKRLRVEPSQNSPDDLVPMISHLVWVRPNHFKSSEFKFLHYISVISALYVAGFRHVYVHGDIQPYGVWWDRLEKENVTFIKIESPESVFQQVVKGPAHQSDVLRLTILMKYGGAYQDRDVVWVSPIPEEVRRYPVSTCYDWPENGEWPAVFNMGVVLAKKNAEWLRHFLRTFLHYRDDKWAFNAVFMPYKAYEFHPDQLYVDTHLQTICFQDICHPAWHEDYKRYIFDTSPVAKYHWSETRAFHFTKPKPPPSLVSIEALKAGDDMVAEFGRFILKTAGKTWKDFGLE